MDGLIPAHAGKTEYMHATYPDAQAHPRSRGENALAHFRAHLEQGSSPLTRGKPAAPHKAQVTMRAHPRSRGENVAAEAATSTATGSSPLTRGKPLLPTAPKAPPGLIPAHAGKTATLARALSCFWAHPRSRGENVIAVLIDDTPLGSSPLTRGKHVSDETTLAKCGLIPAHAGKTLGGRGMGSIARAHPRSRGENINAGSYLQTIEGSSPLTRGKPASTISRSFSNGLIPAHAGKTTRGRAVRFMGGAHPRSRGENSTGEYFGATAMGSSPLTRGKHFLTCAFIAQIGQILESLELCASSESYSLMDAYATDALQDRVRSIGLVPRSSRGASSA